MRGNRRLLIASVVGLMAVSAALWAGSLAQAKKAKTQHFQVLLTSTQQVPVVNETSSGIGYVTLSPTNELCFHFTHQGLSSDENAAHFHPGPPGENGSPILNLPLGNPKHACLNSTALGEQVIGGDASGFLGLLKRNGLYVNIHTVNHGSGEIRGQVLRIK